MDFRSILCASLSNRITIEFERKPGGAHSVTFMLFFQRLKKEKTGQR
jgi:hypothetical protein